jgi:hypothetical protein
MLKSQLAQGSSVLYEIDQSFAEWKTSSRTSDRYRGYECWPTGCRFRVNLPEKPDYAVHKLLLSRFYPRSGAARVVAKPRFMFLDQFGHKTMNVGFGDSTPELGGPCDRQSEKR